jgi:hypothetical protein
MVHLPVSTARPFNYPYMGVDAVLEVVPAAAIAGAVGGGAGVSVDASTSILRFKLLSASPYGM